MFEYQFDKELSILKINHNSNGKGGLIDSYSLINTQLSKIRMLSSQELLKFYNVTDEIIYRIYTINLNNYDDLKSDNTKLILNNKNYEVKKIMRYNNNEYIVFDVKEVE